MALVKPSTAKTIEAEVISKTVTQEEVEMEVDVEVDVEVEEVKQEVQVSQGTQVSEAATPLTGMKALLEEQANLGFEDIEVSQFSFDRIKLSEGSFWQGETDIGDKFKFIPLSSRANYIVKQDSGEDAKMFYSYDPQGLTTSDGQSSKSIRDEWKEEGYDTEDNPVVILKYMEIMAQLVVDGEAGDVVSLSIPPSSRARFGQVPTMAKMRFGVDTNGVIVEASVGAKVGEGKKAFRPWNFKVVSRA